MLSRTHGAGDLLLSAPPPQNWVRETRHTADSVHSRHTAEHTASALVSATQSAPRCRGHTRRAVTASASSPAAAASPHSVLRSLQLQLATRQRSSVEVTDAYLAAIAASQPALNAFSAVCPDAARKQAQAADARLAAGSPLGPLDGIPFSVKVRVVATCQPRVLYHRVWRSFG